MFKGKQSLIENAITSFVLRITLNNKLKIVASTKAQKGTNVELQKNEKR